MILQYEIEHLIKLFELKDNETSRDATNVLRRVLIELRTVNNLLRESMLLTSESELEGLKILRENLELRKEVERLTGLINELDEKG
jgi:hypothetical protein